MEPVIMKTRTLVRTTLVVNLDSSVRSLVVLMNQENVRRSQRRALKNPTQCAVVMIGTTLTLALLTETEPVLLSRELVRRIPNPARKVANVSMVTSARNPTVAERTESAS